MTDYIKRTDAVKIAEKYGLANGSALGRHTGLADCIASEILSLPAADVAPVVRCKDCQNWKRNVGLTDSPNGHCFEHDIDTNGRDFCSYGERMRRRSGEADSREPGTAGDTEL